MYVGIIGLGLIGGSIARTLKKKNRDIKIIAFDCNEEQLKMALLDENIDSYTLDLGSLQANAFQNCDIIFMCTPINVTIKIIEVIKDVINEDCLITDVSSTKEEVSNTIKKINGINFIGGHPMAGSEKSGYINSSDILFENAFYIVTPFENSKKIHIEMLKGIIKILGGVYVELSPEEHDEAVSMISHIPHILSSVLVNFVRENDNQTDLLKTIAAGGFKDITRIASSDGILWNSIIKSNKKTIVKNYKKFIEEQIKILDVIEKEDETLLIDYIEKGKTYRNSFKNTPNYLKSYDISVDVPDEPNVIGIVATKLGENNINIKNIGINHNREDNVFALTVSFYDEFAMNNATTVLIENNYEVKIL